MSDQEEKSAPSAFDWLPSDCEPLADGEYDAIILGTGLKECILSGLLAVNGKKVLHVDRNNYYGGDCASLNLSNLYAKFRDGAEPMEGLGSNRDYNIGTYQHLVSTDVAFTSYHRLCIRPHPQVHHGLWKIGQNAPPH